MTNLDDALNTSAPVFDAVDLTVNWQELPPGASVGGVDSIRDFGQQVGPEGFDVSHSLDDGLPDAVTMTSSNDASGSLNADLVGRPSNVADILTGWRASTTSGSGSGTSIPVTLPTGLEDRDYVIVAITASNQSGVYENGFEPGHPHGWETLAEVSDGTLTTYVFGRSHWLATPAPDFRIRTTGSWSWATGAIGVCYTAGSSSLVPVRPEVISSLAETVSGTAHNGPYATLPSRGYLLGVFSAPNASGPWTGATGGTQLVQSTGGVAALQLVKADIKLADGDYRFTSNTTGATAIAMMVNIPLTIRDRPFMDATAFFSPFNAASPINGFERDTADVTAGVRVVGPAGVTETTVFSGQMADIALGDRGAKMAAISKTRLDLDKAIVLPTVRGDREGCTTDWLASYVMAQGGQYPGIATSPFTRFWAPMHGSLHAGMGGINSYAGATTYEAARTPHGPYGLKPPKVVPGPFVSGMHAQITDARVDNIFVTCDTTQWDTVSPGQDTQKYDFATASNSVGRMSFWIRGDANTPSPTALVGTGEADHLFRASIYTYYDPAGDYNFIRLLINSARQPVVYLENGQTLTGGDIPTDGAWHFVGFVWDYASGLARVRRDNLTWNVGSFTSSSHAMAASEDAIYAAGRKVVVSMTSRLPIAEFQIEAGPTLYADQFSRFYPTPTAPSLNATFRPTYQPVSAVWDTAPVQGWSVLQEVAESTASAMRLNEEDNLELLPLSYFGETAQMTVAAYNVLDTDVNAAALGVKIDPSKTRNFVTVDYDEVSVDLNRTSVLDVTSPVPIPGGKTVQTFYTDLPLAEVHGAANPAGVTWALTVLTSAQVSGVTALPNEHFMSINKYSDGSAVPYAGSGITARIISWTSSSITIQFNNTLGSTYWLSNNGQNVPFLRLLGYPIRSVDAYFSFRDVSSTARRRERSLTVSDVPWVQNRDTAVIHAGRLTTAMSQPRPELDITVMGDPRRRPGQLATVKDAEGTQAGGTWRILSVGHDGNGPMYVQKVHLVRVGPVGYWDQGLWDDAVWGE